MIFAVRLFFSLCVDVLYQFQKRFILFLICWLFILSWCWIISNSFLLLLREFVKIHVNFFTGSVNKVSYISLFQMLDSLKIYRVRKPLFNLVMVLPYILFDSRFANILFRIFLSVFTESKISLQFFTFLLCIVLICFWFEDFLISYINWSCSVLSFYSRVCINILIIYFFKCRQTYL